MNQPEESFDEFERELTLALRGVDPPDGFAERTMARAKVPAPAVGKLLALPMRIRLWAGGAVAAALLVGAIAGEEVHLRRQRERAELAQRQFEAAMRITDETLDNVRQQLQQAGVRIGD